MGISTGRTVYLVHKHPILHLQYENLCKINSARLFYTQRRKEDYGEEKTHSMLPNRRLDLPAVHPRTGSKLEIAPRILEQRSEIVEFDGEKCIGGDVERCPISSVSHAGVHVFRSGVVGLLD
jgi:hypothetical protein